MDFPGVYCITHLPSGRCYVGSSRRVMHRLWNHRWSLRKANHHNRHLQHYWNHGPETDFDFFVVEICPAQGRADREAFWISRLAADETEFGFNIGDPRLVVVSPATRRRMSLRMIGRNTWTKGVPRSPEVRARMGTWLRGLKRSEASKQRYRESKTGDRNPQCKIKGITRQALLDDLSEAMSSGMRKWTAAKLIAPLYGLSTEGAVLILKNALTK